MEVGLMPVPNEKPNILLIMADQLTPFMTGCYGNSEVLTPNLDRLTADGVRFDAAYTPCPLCSPARASMMTGRYASDIGCYDNGSVISSEEPTFAHCLSASGYDTVLSGKMHFIGSDQLHGFGKRLTTDIYPAEYQLMPRFVDESRHITQSDAWGNAANYNAQSAGARPWSVGINYDEETHFRAREYLYGQAGMNWNDQAAKDPFFLCVSYHHPHDPFHPSSEDWDLYEGKNITLPEITREMEENYSTLDKWLNNGFHRSDVFPIKGQDNLYALRRAYSALVSYIDRKVGELLADLEATGLDKNTVVLFTSDHGDMLGEKGMVQKRCFYEWSSRIPLILKRPDEPAPGSTVSTPVSLLDLGPTILDLAGVATDEGYCPDGQSLLPVIRDEEAYLEREVISESHGEGVMCPTFMIRRGDYKLTYIHNHERQLFHLPSDPSELHNLAGSAEYSEIESSLLSRLMERFDSDKIEKDFFESLKKRRLIQKALGVNQTHWDFQPTFNASKRYHRVNTAVSDES
jgi:choline-sulfatase